MKLFKSVTLLLLAFLFVKADAQTTEDKQIIKKDKKVVIITKTIDKDGTEVIEKVVKEGDDVNDIHIIDGNGEEIEIEVQNMTDGVMKEIKIISDGDNEVEIIRDLDDLEDIDKELIQTIDVMKSENGNQVKIIMKGDGDNDFNFEWEGDGEMPDDVKKQLEEKGIKMFESKDGEFLTVTYDGDEDLHLGHDNKAFLGVMIGETEEVTNEDGVETVEKTESAEIIKIIEGSAAEAAGLQKGDIITSIDGKAINGFKDVVEVLGDYKPEDKITINYTRDEEAKSTEVTLKGADKQKVMVKTWTDEDGNSFEFDDDEGENVFIFSDDEDGEHKVVKKRKKVIIIKEDGKKEVKITEEIDAKENKNELDVMDIDLYPNPTNGVLKVNFKTKAKPTTVTITDLSGKEYFKKELKDFKGEFNQEIDLKDAPKGALILIIAQGKKTFSEKIIVE